MANDDVDDNGNGDDYWMKQKKINLLQKWFEMVFSGGFISHLTVP